MKTESPLVSVIITTYKRNPEIVCRAIKSVLLQTYQNLDIIVVDDSPDSFENRTQVEAEVKKLSGSILYIKHSKNKGACAARNTGLKASKGEFIAYLDDDDEWISRKIEMQLSAVKEDIALVYCGHMIINDKTGEKTIISAIEKHPSFEKILYKNFIGSTSFPLIRRRVLCDIGGFDENLKSAQDYDVWIRIVKQYNISYVETPLVIYHVSGEQISSNPLNKIQGLESIIKKYEDDFLLFPKAYWKSLICIVPYYCHAGEKKRAIKTWLSAFKIKPYYLKSNFEYLLRIILS